MRSRAGNAFAPSVADVMLYLKQWVYFWLLHWHRVILLSDRGRKMWTTCLSSSCCVTQNYDLTLTCLYATLLLVINLFELCSLIFFDTYRFSLHSSACILLSNLLNVLLMLLFCYWSFIISFWIAFTLISFVTSRYSCPVLFSVSLCSKHFLCVLRNISVYPFYNFCWKP